MKFTEKLYTNTTLRHFHIVNIQQAVLIAMIHINYFIGALRF